jgi:hypothetical protein
MTKTFMTYFSNYLFRFTEHVKCSIVGYFTTLDYTVTDRSMIDE